MEVQDDQVAVVFATRLSASAGAQTPARRRARRSGSAPRRRREPITAPPCRRAEMRHSLLSLASRRSDEERRHGADPNAGRELRHALLRLLRGRDPRAHPLARRLRRGALRAEGLLESARAAAHARAGRVRGRGFARRDRARAARRLPARRRACRAGLHLGRDRRGDARARRVARHPGERRLRGHARPGGERRRGHPVWLRVNPGFGHGHSRKTNTGGESSKHGIWHEKLDGAAQEAR